MARGTSRWFAGRTRQERQGAGGIVESLGRGCLEEAVHVGLGGRIAQPGAEQGAGLDGVQEVGVDGEGRFDLGQGRAGVVTPQEEGPAEMGAGVLRVEAQGAGEVRLGAGRVACRGGSIRAPPAVSGRPGWRRSRRRRPARPRRGDRGGPAPRPGPPGWTGACRPRARARSRSRNACPGSSSSRQARARSTRASAKLPSSSRARS